MRNPRVASRYAKALISLSEERKELDVTKNDADVILAALKETRELRVLMTSPVVKPEKKQAIITEIFSSAIGELTLKFINLLVSQRREHLIQEVLNSLIQQYYEVKNIVKAKVSTAVALDDKLRNMIIATVKEQTSKDVVVEETINPDLIGGVVVRVGDSEFDASLSGRLKKLSREFEENLYVSEL